MVAARSSSATSRNTRIPKKFLENILLTLKHRGLVQSRKGPHGGYQLGRPPTTISVGDVIRAVDGPLALVSCVSQTAYAPCEECVTERDCAVRRVFQQVRDETARILDGTTLAEPPGCVRPATSATRPTRLSWGARGDLPGSLPPLPLSLSVRV